MRSKLTKIITIAGLCLIAGTSMKMADMNITEPPNDPKRKKAGEECKAADECQRHHSCSKVGDKQVCTAPPVRHIPNT